MTFFVFYDILLNIESKMKKPIKFLISLIAMAFFIWACSSKDDTPQMVDDDVAMSDDVDPIDDSPDESETPMNGQIVFPDDAAVDLTGASVTISGEVIPLDSNSDLMIPSFEGESELAFLSDSNGNILLMGFIGEGREELSIASTAAVFFYFSTTAYFQNSELTSAILDSIEENEEYLAFINTLESLFVNDNMVIENLGFLNALETSIASIRDVRTTNPTNAIFVESNDIRSKIQLNVASNEENTFDITNRGPRRAEAFIYKTAFTDMDGNRTELSNPQLIATEPLSQGRFKPGQDRQVPVQGALLQFLVPCGTIFKPETTAPLPLPLEDNEANAEFEVVVIGPGQNEGERNFRGNEREVFERLSTKTFLLDYALPTLFEISGRKSEYDKLSGDTSDAALLEVITPYFQANPSVRDLVFEGEYNIALQTFFQDLDSGLDIFDLTEQAYEVVFMENANTDAVEFTDDLIDNLVDLTDILNGITNRFSLFCADEIFSGSRFLESWNLTADRGDVSLEPLRAGVQIFDTDLEITADIAGVEDEELTDGSIMYEWTVSENFDSILFDDEGNRGTSFTNTTNSVRFGSFTTGFNLVGFENIETVTVRAFRETNGTEQLIGTTEMTVNVQDRLFRVSPLNTILNGIEQVNLQVQNIDGNPLVENDEFEFRVVWTTSGAHALFNGNSTTETVLNNNSIVLRNLDDKVENAIQSVRAGIFLRPKNNPNDIPFREVAFEFIDVFITNNNTIEFEVDAKGVTYNRFPVGTGRRVQLGGGFIIPFDERAISYSAEIINFQLINSVGNDIGARYIGSTYKWTNTSQSSPVGLLNDSSDSPGDFGIVLLGSNVGINADGTGSDNLAATVALYATTVGSAKITIVLGDE